MHPRLWTAVALCAVTTATVPAVRAVAPGRQPSQASAAADDRARAVLALADAERAAALQALSPAAAHRVSRALAALAERWRVAGQNADALAAARLAVHCAERAADDRAACTGAEPPRCRHQRPRGLHRLHRRAATQHHAQPAARRQAHPCRSAGHTELCATHPGDIDKSLAASTESLAIRRELGVPADIVASLNSVAMAERQRGRYDVAVERYEEAVALAHSPAPTCSWRGR